MLAVESGNSKSEVEWKLVVPTRRTVPLIIYVQYSCIRYPADLSLSAVKAQGVLTREGAQGVLRWGWVMVGSSPPPQPARECALVP
jgi:hypothetical protein